MKEGMLNNYCLNQPTIVEKAFNTVKEYELGFEPSDEPLIEVRLREGLYLNVYWLTYPFIDYEGRMYKLADFLEVAEESYKVDLVKDILENWFKQFCHLCSDKVKGGWAANYNALSVIWYAIQNGEEFNVYVPMFDINFTNEDGENGDEELWKPVEAFGVFIGQAMDCYEYILDNDNSSNDILEELNDGHSLYARVGDLPAGVVTCGTEADVDREFTEEDRAEAVKKLEKVRAKLKRQADESVTAFKQDATQRELAAKAVMRKAAMRKADKLAARIQDKHMLTATRKLKDCLAAFKKYHLPEHTLDVDGWVVRLELASAAIAPGKADYGYTIKLPWVSNKLTFDEFDLYVTAKKDKKCPVAWEYLYIINEALKNL